jgi:sugar phosphate isomerase/epimerase
MTTPRVLASTTSHKREALLPTLEVFSRLGLRHVDLNLHHLLELGVPVEEVLRSVDAGGLQLRVVSGGWCDFFHRAPQIEETFRSIERQVGICRQLGVPHLRLFFGRLKYQDYTPALRDVLCANLRRLSENHPEMAFMFENHDGASLRPEVCREVLEGVDRPNIRLNFDPINFERAGVDHLAALALLAPFIGHVHLKGLEAGEFCEFGAGDIDLMPALRQLLCGGYLGNFTVEYEGPCDGTLRLYQSVRRAEAALGELGATL